MSKLTVNGGKRLCGEVDIQGAKNSVLPILSATLLIHGRSVIKNCPDLSDLSVALKILTYLGCKCIRDGDTVTVDAGNVICDKIPDDLMREMRSSVMFLGSILARCSSAVISSPGGCELGPRPIDLHLKALRELGYTVCEDGGYIVCEKTSKAKIQRITSLAFPSVGATENAILASVLLEGETIIRGAAKEPEISDLADFLVSAGANINGAGTDTIIIKGVKKLFETVHTVIPDRIVAATYMSAAVATCGEIRLNRIRADHMSAVINCFYEMGANINCQDDSLTIASTERPRAISLIKTLVYPGFPTDAGPVVSAALTLAKGCSLFVETIFENRFRYMDELSRYGANIRVQNKVAVIEGVERLRSAKVKATDLRGGAALVIAALAADGRSEIGEIHHIDRGYENIEGTLKKLGADINREV